MTDPLLIDLPVHIDTQRLILRPPRAGDGPMFHAAVVESLTELRRFLASLSWVAAQQSVEQAEAHCRNAQANFIARRDLPFLVLERSSGEMVGVAGLHRTEWSTPKTEVGYWGRASRSGHGFVTEAVEALVDYAFIHIQAVRVELITDEDNHASRRVAERCRFGLEGTLRSERRATDGSLRNTCIYARFPPAR
jgi:RimJ/RimL family protein N-acetyltransferase